MHDPVTRRDGPLNWAQQWHWLEQQLPPQDRFLSLSLALSRVREVPDGVAEEAVRAVLDSVVERHEALRTRFSAVRPWQEVLHEAPVELTVRDADRTTATDEERIAAAVDVVGDEFDLDRGRPIRAVLLRHGGRPAWLVLVMHHAVVDSIGADLVASEVAVLLSGAATGRTAALPAPAWHPLDQVAAEARPDRAAAGRRSLEYWEKAIRGTPANPLAPYCTGEPQLRTSTVAIRSSRFAARLAEAGRRTGASPVTLVTAAFVRALAERTGCEQVVVETVGANRHDPVVAAGVGCYALLGQHVVDVSGRPDLATLCERTWSASIRGHRYGAVEPSRLLETEIRETHRSGRQARSMLHLNHRTSGEAPAGGPAEPADDEVTAWTEDGFCDTVYVDANPSWPRLEILLRAGDHLLSEQDAQDLLTGALDALTDPAWDGPAPVAGPGWVRCGTDWVHLPAVVGTLRACPGVRGADVVPGPDGRLVAHVVPDGSDLTPADVRRSVVDTAALTPLVAAPQWFVFHADEPAGADPAAWEGHPVLLEGDGLEPAVGRVGTEEELVLAALVGEQAGTGEVDLDRPYACAAGVLTVPSLLARLRAAGWSGVSAADLLSAVSLRHVATTMVPVSGEAAS